MLPLRAFWDIGGAGVSKKCGEIDHSVGAGCDDGGWSDAGGGFTGVTTCDGERREAAPERGFNSTRPGLKRPGLTFRQSSSPTAISLAGCRAPAEADAPA